MNELEGLMRRFTIRLRMWGAIAIVLLLLGVVGATGVAGLVQLESVNHRFSEDIGKRAEGLGLLRTQMGDLRRYEKDMIISYEKPELVIEYRDKWLATVKKTRAQIDELLAMQTAGQAELLSSMRKNIDEYVAATEPVIKQLEASGYDNATVANRVLGRAKEAIRASEKQLGELNAQLQAATAEAKADGVATTQRTFWIFGTALAVAMVVVVPLTLANMVSICRPLDASRRLAQAIAAGDLSTPLAVRGRDETADLQRALLEMQRSLTQIVGQVRNSADSINTASAEVANGNGDLSQRTEEAAGSLQQTASSMEQLTATVRQSADAARQASELASSATQVAAHGGSVVAQVVATMEDINSSSRRIADIIGTIDGIAFQTNILALNAAVEAARAGEQGRGFAVVASEVRSLAQRSAEAAREIKTLIGASVDKVEIGSRQVADAGSTMGDIVSSVRRVSDIIGEISAAAGEQSSGIGQVNGAVAQLDQSTQQNAALVEQSAAAAESLRDEASRLAQLVATFKLQPA